jgi:MFS family permease
MQEYTPPVNGFRTFVVVWATQSISALGSAMTFFAMNIWLVQVQYPLAEQKAQLAWALSAVSLCFAIPIMIFGPIAGAWADRHDRKQIMIAANLLNGLISVGLVWLLVEGLLSLWLLLAVIVLTTTIGAFHGSAFDTSYAMLVPEKHLPRANGMMQSMNSLAGILAPAFAATVIALPELARQGVLPRAVSGLLRSLSNGASLAIAVDAVSFFFAAAVLVFLFIPSPRRSDLHAANGVKKSIWSDVKEGTVYIWRRRPLLWLLGAFAVVNFTAGPIAMLIPLMLRFNLQGDWLAHGFTYETALALLNSAMGVGGVLGGVIMSAWGGMRRRIYGVLIPMILLGLAQTLFGLSNFFFISVALIFMIDFTIPFMNAHSQTIWQAQTPREMQGRVFAVRRVIGQFTWPISTALAGWVGGLFNPGHVLAVLGVVGLVFCAAQFFNAHLLSVEEKQALDHLAEQGNIL